MASGTNTRTTRRKTKKPVKLNFTGLMTLLEAATVLEVLKVDHLQRIALQHAVKHWPVERVLAEGPALMQDHSLGWIVRGTVAENIAACEQCRPALNAARLPDQPVGASVKLSRHDLLRLGDGSDTIDPDGLFVAGARVQLTEEEEE